MLEPFPRDKQFLREIHVCLEKANEVLQGPTRLFYPGLFRTHLLEHSKEVSRGSLDGKVRLEILHSGELILGTRVLEVEGRYTIRLLEISRPIDRNWFPGMDVLYFVKEEEYDLLKDALSVFSEKDHTFPFLLADVSAAFRQNTIDFLLEDEKTYAEYAIPYRRGLLLAGRPGNGKTMACRWLLQECKKNDFLVRVVTPNEYLAARDHYHIETLFELDGHGVIIFDDLDIALRNREADKSGGWDQANFLTALDGIMRQEGVVYIFTTNIELHRLDPAICRPGRIDITLEFPPPTCSLRQQLIESWPEKVRIHIPNLTLAARETKNFSFADLEEVHRIFVLGFIKSSKWDWAGAVSSFKKNQESFKRGFTRDATS